MAKGLVQDSTLTGIANAIRSKGGTSAPLKPSQMAAAINNIPTGTPIYIGTIRRTTQTNLSSQTITHNLGFTPSHMVVYGYINSDSRGAFVLYFDDADVWGAGYGVTSEEVADEDDWAQAYFTGGHATYTATTARASNASGTLKANRTYRVLIW